MHRPHQGALHNYCALGKIPIPTFPSRLGKEPESLFQPYRRRSGKVLLSGEAVCDGIPVKDDAVVVRPSGARAWRQGAETCSGALRFPLTTLLDFSASLEMTFGGSWRACEWYWETRRPSTDKG